MKGNGRDSATILDTSADSPSIAPQVGQFKLHHSHGPSRSLPRWFKYRDLKEGILSEEHIRLRAQARDAKRPRGSSQQEAITTSLRPGRTWEEVVLLEPTESCTVKGEANVAGTAVTERS